MSKFDENLVKTVLLLKTHARRLDAWEDSLQHREELVEEFLVELRLMQADLMQGDTSLRYSLPEFFIEDGVRYVDISTIPTRETNVLLLLQQDVGKHTFYVTGSNTELALRYAEKLTGLNTSAFSACLTRMQHRKLIHLVRVGKERRIMLLARVKH